MHSFKSVPVVKKMCKSRDQEMVIKLQSDTNMTNNKINARYLKIHAISISSKHLTVLTVLLLIVELLQLQRQQPILLRQIKYWITLMIIKTRGRRIVEFWVLLRIRLNGKTLKICKNKHKRSKNYMHIDKFNYVIDIEN